MSLSTELLVFFLINNSCLGTAKFAEHISPILVLKDSQLIKLKLASIFGTNSDIMCISFTKTKSGAESIAFVLEVLARSVSFNKIEPVEKMFQCF